MLYTIVFVMIFLGIAVLITGVWIASKIRTLDKQNLNKKTNSLPTTSWPQSGPRRPATRINRPLSDTPLQLE